MSKLNKRVIEKLLNNLGFKKEKVYVCNNYHLVLNSNHYHIYNINDGYSMNKTFNGRKDVLIDTGNIEEFYNFLQNNFKHEIRLLKINKLLVNG